MCHPSQMIFLLNVTVYGMHLLKVESMAVLRLPPSYGYFSVHDDKQVHYGLESFH